MQKQLRAALRIGKNSPSKYQLQYLIELVQNQLSTTIGNDVFDI